MANIYENILTGLQEAIDDSISNERKLQRRVVSIVPVKEYTSKEVKSMMEFHTARECGILRIRLRRL